MPPPSGTQPVRREHSGASIKPEAEQVGVWIYTFCFVQLPRTVLRERSAESTPCATHTPRCSGGVSGTAACPQERGCKDTITIEEECWNGLPSSLARSLESSG